MSGFVWLASYPRSGNTWFRLLHASLDGDGDDPPDINDLGAGGGSAGARLSFDAITLLDSSLLSIDETDRLRPAVYRAIASGAYRDPAMVRGAGMRLMKIHDAYRRTREGRPVFAGAQGAILIVRDPRAVAASLANFLSCSTDHAIAIMSSDGFSLGGDARGNAVQMPQSVKSWSSNIESWLVQDEVAIHLVRYEDLKADTAAVFRAAMAFLGRALTPDQAGRAAMRTDFAALRRQEAAQGFREWAQLKRAPDSYFFRRGEPQGWREELTAVQIGRIETQHGAMMERLGYPAA
jgi:aryl sulfotransferase